MGKATTVTLARYGFLSPPPGRLRQEARKPVESPVGSGSDPGERKWAMVLRFSSLFIFYNFFAAFSFGKFATGEEEEEEEEKRAKARDLVRSVAQCFQPVMERKKRCRGSKK